MTVPNYDHMPVAARPVSLVLPLGANAILRGIG